MSIHRIERASRICEPERDLPNAQYAKGIDVDDKTYLPGEGLRDWAEEFVEGPNEDLREDYYMYGGES